MHCTAYFVFAVTWIVISSFSYGYHISALNSAQDAITCRWHGSSTPFVKTHMLPLTSCLVMSDNLFGLLTSSYTIGGFGGSLYASHLANSQGRKRSILIGSLLIAFGSALMALATSFIPMLLGRTIIGLGCGLNTVLVPIYLSEISPVAIRGSIGVMNQLGIVIGILASQVVSMPLAKPFIWRWIFVISGCINAFQLVIAPLMIESPKWAMEQEAKRAGILPTQSTLRNESEDLTEAQGPNDDVERQGLLSHHDSPGANEVHAQTSTSQDELSISELFREWHHDPVLASGLKVVLITQLAQQLSGVNAVLYYSTSIMKSVLPTQAAYISLFITFINVLMTFPPIFLIDRTGRKPLLIISAGMMALTSCILGFSINIGFAQLSSLAIVCFVASFSLGLGPIPFVILSELVPTHAISATGGLALGVNWAANFAVGLLFLPLRNAMASPDGDGDGNVFFVFTIISTIATLLIARNYR
ncbi:uncharacterized protein MELLADRAFT_44903 [Melampsora larici-populina 98AG31]|uniref:Major facilitator superfamily (MFS) profile domain-containing protein n=1 Tax=Melampsora larici-populina (strain 98AG31 / pathotype 3-4-7) TaxID=747676 RepID=F4RZ44_MELLP|nr:uncharacterized protein MELLADRAFT_44903 [Melampsora larici-populina 98AG31]EGG02384.1 hypothetical protein MELLADRAFT_44903 [Melampsora larici-populina 98AG31]